MSTAGSSSTASISKNYSFLRALLYELLPLRPVDAIKLAAYVKTNATHVFLGVRHFSLILWRDWVLSSVHSLTSKTERVLYFGLFLAGAAIASYVDVFQLYVMLSLSAFICLAGFEERKSGELSAFSVFNEGFKQLLGTTTAEQIDREMRNGQGAAGVPANNPHIAQIAEEVNAIAADMRAVDDKNQRERQEQREQARREVQENPYRQRRGKKKRRDNDRVEQRIERRRQEMADADAFAGFGAGAGAGGMGFDDDEDWDLGSDDDGGEEWEDDAWARE